MSLVAAALLSTSSCCSARSLIGGIHQNKHWAAFLCPPTFSAASRTSLSTKRCPRGITKEPALFLVDSYRAGGLPQKGGRHSSSGTTHMNDGITAPTIPERLSSLPAPTSPAPAACPAPRGCCSWGQGCPRRPAGRRGGDTHHALRSFASCSDRLLSSLAAIRPPCNPHAIPSAAWLPGHANYQVRSRPCAHLALLMLRGDEEAVGLVAGAAAKLHGWGGGFGGLRAGACRAGQVK